MKYIAIFCDGTWNRSDARHPTNVVRLAQALAPQSADAVPQVAVYLPGVGTGQGATTLARVSDRVLGGALGLGLTESLADAFRQLVFLYEPGDRIFVFGFSRGAFMARSLVGLIRSTGIPPRSALERLPSAIGRYRERSPEAAVSGEAPLSRTHPGSESSHRFRSEISPHIATSEAEAEWRVAQGMPRPRVLSIDYLGVFDTVGALGVPGQFFAAPLLNRRVQFHDTRLTSIVKAARHALALDERRTPFVPTLWGNVGELNRRALALEDSDPLELVPVKHLKFREEWFAGDHGSIGGGGIRKGLSALTIAWIAEGAAEEGLAFDPVQMATIAEEADGMAPLYNHVHANVMDQVMRWFGKDRDGPSDKGAVSHAAMDRVKNMLTYRPGSLKRVVEGILSG